MEGKKFIANSFSFNMIQKSYGRLKFKELDLETSKNWIQENNPQSFIGHEDTARIVSNLLEKDIPYNRGNISFEVNDVILIAQYVGPRLLEGTRQLPEGAKIKWILVTIEE